MGRRNGIGSWVCHLIVDIIIIPIISPIYLALIYGRHCGDSPRLRHRTGLYVNDLTTTTPGIIQVSRGSRSSGGGRGHGPLGYLFTGIK